MDDYDWINADCSEALEFVCEAPPEGEVPSTEPPTSPPEAIECPDNPGWITFNESITNYCYKPFLELMSWNEAKDRCQQDGASLVSIHDNKENEFVILQLYNQGVDQVWIGLYNQSKAGGWTWTDGSGFDYQNWAQNQPSSTWDMENCVEMLTSK